MFDLSPAVLISGFIIGTFGMVLFIYGKNQEDFLILGAGVLLSVIPFVTASVALLWILTLATIVGVILYRKYV